MKRHPLVIASVTALVVLGSCRPAAVAPEPKSGNGSPSGTPASPASIEPGAARATLPAVRHLAGAIPALPQPVSNNAVAAVTIEKSTYLVSFLGLGPGKTWRDTLAVGYQLRVGESSWRRVSDVPPGPGRLAGTSVAIGPLAYIIGGYTVAEDGSEHSVETVHTYDPRTGEYRSKKPMPIPVDDAVALVYRDRYIYLISGWHDLGNVNLTQVYDTHTDSWTQATPFPGTPVFGHAGGMHGDTMVIADGVAIATATSGRRQFVMSSEAYIGRVDPKNHRRIEWHLVPPHPGPARYRMAATGTKALGGAVLFAGGSDNPYNYNGIGYNKKPSAPSDELFALTLADRTWRRVGRLPAATMDHRALVEIDGRFAIIGGMRADQTVTAETIVFALPGHDAP